MMGTTSEYEGGFPKDPPPPPPVCDQVVHFQLRFPVAQALSDSHSNFSQRKVKYFYVFSAAFLMQFSSWK